MKGMGVFNADYYSRYRPFYPATTFASLRENLLARGFREPFGIGDIGCGTGHSAVSLLQAGVQAQIIGVDPDPGMLNQARVLSKAHGMNDRVAFEVGTAEETGLRDRSLDAILVGSAFHWMDSRRTLVEFRRVLKLRGVVRIFEYQFPKALEHPELNEWIRGRFNRDWKAPNQVPRGNFAQVTREFRESSEWELLGEEQPPMRIELSADDVVGMILSQSRVLHYERTLDEAPLLEFRRELDSTVRGFVGGRKLDFDFKLAWVEFEARASVG